MERLCSFATICASKPLQSGFDGAELLARPGIEVVSVEPGNHPYVRADGCVPRSLSLS